MENKLQEKVFDFSNNPQYMNKCVGIEPRMTGFKYDTLTRDYLPDYKSMIIITFKYVMLNTTNAFNRSTIIFCLSELLYAWSHHRRPQAASRRWNRSARSFSDI